MKRVVIIGGGFAGLSAAECLKKYKKQVEVVLIDKKSRTDFLPLLPDILSERIDNKFLSADLNKLGEKLLFDFINSRVNGIDLEKKKISLIDKDLSYDYLIISSGSQTNFYNNISLSKSAFKLDDIHDAKFLLDCLDCQKHKSFIVSGGGYTGIEIATNIWRYFFKKDQKKRIVIIEKASILLAKLPDWMREYVMDNLLSLGVEIRLDAQIESYSQDRVILKGGESFANAALIWTAGVKVQDFVWNYGFVCDHQGRVIVDEYLRLNSNCFCVGDTAHFDHKGAALRMSIQFSIMQGALAAANIMRCITNKQLKEYRPFDPGYIIPMANNKACGNVFGLKVKGPFAVLLHYSMCIFRSYSLSNKLGIIKNLLKGF